MMCKMLASALTLVILLAAAPSRAAEVCVFILAGQSNANGYGVSADLPPEVATRLAPEQNAVVMNHYNSLVPGSPWHASFGWVPLATGTGGPGVGTFGAEISLGLELEQAGRCPYVGIVKMAQGSTRLDTDWNVNNPAGLWPAFKQFTTAALAQLTTAGLSYEIQGMLWIQGESDSAIQGGSAAAAYAANLAALVAASRSHFGAPELDFYIGRLPLGLRFDGAPTPYLHEVRKAQEDVAGADPRTHLVETDDLPLLVEQAGTLTYEVHYSGPALLTLGKRVAQLALAIEAAGVAGP
jgi:hypothetical protein